MREIKFRVFDEQSGEFVFSDIQSDWYHFEFIDGKLVAFALDEEYEYVEGITVAAYPIGRTIDGDMEEFTGLLDKNGKEIYEGDICKWLGYEVKGGQQVRPERQFVVEWEFVKLYQYENIVIGNETVEIIGNIHENPELLTCLA